MSLSVSSLKTRIFHGIQIDAKAASELILSRLAEVFNELGFGELEKYTITIFEQKGGCISPIACSGFNTDRAQLIEGFFIIIPDMLVPNTKPLLACSALALRNVDEMLPFSKFYSSAVEIDHIASWMGVTVKFGDWNIQIVVDSPTTNEFTQEAANIVQQRMSTIPFRKLRDSELKSSYASISDTFGFDDVVMWLARNYEPSRDSSKITTRELWSHMQAYSQSHAEEFVSPLIESSQFQLRFFQFLGEIFQRTYNNCDLIEWNTGVCKLRARSVPTPPTKLFSVITSIPAPMSQRASKKLRTTSTPTWTAFGTHQQ